MRLLYYYPIGDLLLIFDARIIRDQYFGQWTIGVEILVWSIKLSLGKYILQYFITRKEWQTMQKVNYFLYGLFTWPENNFLGFLPDLWFLNNRNCIQEDNLPIDKKTICFSIALYTLLMLRLSMSINHWICLLAH